MASFNKVLLMGNLTRKPELRYTPGGQAVCDIGLAVNRRYSVNGQDKEEVCFVDIVVWAKQAEACSEYLFKGSSLFVEGRLQLDMWESKEGQRRSRLRVVAQRVQFLGRPRGEKAAAATGEVSEELPEEEIPVGEENKTVLPEEVTEEEAPF